MVGKMKKISFLFVFLYFITLLFVVACSETGELPVAPVPEIPSITIPVSYTHLTLPTIRLV